MNELTKVYVNSIVLLFCPLFLLKETEDFFIVVFLFVFFLFSLILHVYLCYNYCSVLSIFLVF